jgi:hypothetical protein
MGSANRQPLTFPITGYWLSAIREATSGRLTGLFRLPVSSKRRTPNAERSLPNNHRRWLVYFFLLTSQSISE